jgi:TIR domain
MTYVPGCEYDVFVSYAHVDNRATDPSGQGWVDALHRNFEVLLAQRLGRPDTAVIWRDQQSLRGNQEVTGYISEQVRRSALLLLVLSRGYLTSRSCLKELETFTERNPSNRIFVVHTDSSEKARDSLPAAIRDLLGYRFWLDENQKVRMMGFPLPRGDSDEDKKYYYRAVVDLAIDVRDTLDALHAAGGTGALGPGPIPRARPRKGAVLLAEVADDLNPRRDDMRRYLAEADIDALPTGNYRLTRIEFEQAFVSDLQGCKAFVQLLGPHASKAPPGVPEGFCRLQLDLARAHNVPILQWRSPQLDLATVEAQAQRALLGSDSVQAMPFEEFKRSVADMFIEAKPEPPRDPPFLFVNASEDDIQSADTLFAELDDWRLPLYDPSDTAEDRQRAAEKNLVESDAIVFFYSNARPGWVVTQIDLWRKVKRQRSEPEPKLLALVVAPPEPKVKIPIKVQGLKVVPYAEAAKLIKTSLRA